MIAAPDLNATVATLRSELGLGEPFADPAIEYFGLRNAVFAIGETFLEVVSPAQEGTAAGRLLERRGGGCGYMAMLQVDDVAQARERARGLGVREVFEVEFDDVTEAHLHPADIGGAIVSITEPDPPSSWRWGGDDWQARSVPGSVAGITVAVANPKATADRWRQVAGGDIPAEFTEDPEERGLVEITLDLDHASVTLDPSRI